MLIKWALLTWKVLSVYMTIRKTKYVLFAPVTYSVWRLSQESNSSATEHTIWALTKITLVRISSAKLPFLHQILLSALQYKYQTDPVSKLWQGNHFPQGNTILPLQVSCISLLGQMILNFTVVRGFSNTEAVLTNAPHPAGVINLLSMLKVEH